MLKEHGTKWESLYDHYTYGGFVYSFKDNRLVKDDGCYYEFYLRDEEDLHD